MTHREKRTEKNNIEDEITAEMKYELNNGKLRW
jgi:hypothetical protein